MATINIPTSPKEDVPKEKFHLDVLNFSQTSQIQFGLRLQDYKKYRQYCSKRIQRLRSQLRKQYGKKNYVNKIVIGEETEKQINDARYLQIALLKSERAWSYAMDLKAQFEKDNDSRIGFHMNRRFGKASRNSTQLYEICKLVADQYTIIEAHAYSSWMASSLSLVKLDFKKALEEINISKTIYEKLSEQGDHSQKELYQKRIEETEPIIRFCLYNLKNEKNTTSNPISKSTLTIIEQSLEELNNQEKKSATTTTTTTTQVIQWQSKSIKVDEKLDEKLKTFNEFKKENENKLPKNSSTLDTTSNISPIFNVYDKLVYNLINCETIVKNDLSNLVRVNLKNKTVKSEIEEQSTKILLAYIMYHKMKYLYERNSILISMMQKVLDGEKVDESAIKKKVKKVTWNDLVRLSSIQVKVYTTMSESRDTDSNKEIARDQDAQLILLKSIRLYYIAVCLAKSSKFSETMAVLDRVLSNIQNVRKTNTKNQQILNDTNELESNIKKQRSQIHANSFIQQLSENQDLKNQMSSLSIGGGGGSSTDKSNDLISGLDSFDTSFLAEKKLVQLPPQLQPVQAKPIFFDLAFNNVTFPSLDQRKKGSSTGTPSKSLFGFWGRS
ncbi:hypothetical protein ACTA71_011922 [Dictyostelium dimigraforme]